mgnify:CR=1 FL=1
MARKPPKGKSLAVINPDLAKQWHTSKNMDLTPSDVTPGSHRKVWWKCNKGVDHEWQARIYSRTAGQNCSICAGRKVVKSNSLATLNPALAKEWHPTKNGDFTPDKITISSSKRVWWKCIKGDDHEWLSSVADRTAGQNCSICAGRKVVKSNSLATLNPALAKEWHPTKNRDLTANDVTPGSSKKVWWKCDKAVDHEWEASVNKRSSGRNCPVCFGQKVVKSNSLLVTHPEVAKEWHPTKNGQLTPNLVRCQSNQKVWWKCDKADDHEYQARIADRINHECPACSGRMVVRSNSLGTKNPELSKQWHPTKNGNLTPFDVTEGSNEIVWWKCDVEDDHEWQAEINNRKNNPGCSVCRGLTVVKSNSLATLNPNLAKQWHPKKNGNLTPLDVTLNSGKKVWWKCNRVNDHEWLAQISNRNISECPYCTLTPQSKQELTITFELIRFFEDINPKGFKTRVNGKLKSIDIYIPELKLGIEFDGSYWHKDKAALDKLKTEQLESQGFEIFRIREEPLKRIFEDDIMSKQPFSAKQVANDILTQIMSRYTLDAKKIAKIESYIAKKEIQNEKGLDKYIEMILTEKAEKKNV